MTKDRDTLKRALNAVSAAIADSGSVVVPNEEERYADAVRQIIVQRDEWRKKWEDLEVHRASCCDRMEQERDTACAAVLEFEGKLAESARIAEGWRALAETLKQTRNKAWSILTGWDPVRLSNNSHVDADDPNEALIVSAGRTKDYLTRCIAERSELEEKLALRTTERDDWKRACHNREDDLRSARHEAERYAAEAQRLRRQLEASLDAGRELVEARSERDEAVSQRDMMSDAEDAANDKLVAAVARAEKAERLAEERKDYARMQNAKLSVDNDELRAELDAKEARIARLEQRCATAEAFRESVVKVAGDYVARVCPGLLVAGEKMYVPLEEYNAQASALGLAYGTIQTLTTSPASTALAESGEKEE